MKFRVLPVGKPGLKIIITGFRSDEQKRKAIKIDAAAFTSCGRKVFTLAHEITFL